MKKNSKITTTEQADLMKNLLDLREEMRSARFSFGATGKNVKAKKTIRKEIARIMTESNRRTRQQA